MKEFDVALKAVAEGLKTIAQGMEKIAEKLEESVPDKQAKAQPARKPAKKPKKVPAKKAVKKTAADAVLAIVNRSKKGVNGATLAEKTGYDSKKVANIVFKLRKQGKIKSVGRGVYAKA